MNIGAVDLGNDANTCSIPVGLMVTSLRMTHMELAPRVG